MTPKRLGPQTRAGKKKGLAGAVTTHGVKDKGKGKGKGYAETIYKELTRDKP